MTADRKTLVYRGEYPDLCIGDATLRILPSGKFIIIFETGGVTEPCVENHIRMCVSEDRGEHWSPPVPVVRLPGRATLPSEVVVTDKLTVYYQSHDGFWENWSNWTISSYDEGRSWAEPEPFLPALHRAYMRNICTLKDGTQLMPIERFPIPDGLDKTIGKDGSFERPENGVLIRRRGQAEWTSSSFITGFRGFAENNVIELSDGTVVMLCRTDAGTGCLLRSDSFDGGKSWSPFRPSGIPNPGSKFRLFSLSGNRIALLHNPDPARRNPLALWISDNDMVSWDYRKILTDFPGNVQYPDGVISADERFLHFAFDYNRHDLIYWCTELPD